MMIAKVNCTKSLDGSPFTCFSLLAMIVMIASVLLFALAVIRMMKKMIMLLMTMMLMLLLLMRIGGYVVCILGPVSHHPQYDTPKCRISLSALCASWVEFQYNVPKCSILETDSIANVLCLVYLQYEMY